MKKFLPAVLLLLLIETLNAQNAELYSERQGRTTVLFARNLEFYPVTARLTLELSNMVFSGASNELKVIPAQSDRYKVGELTAVKKGEVSRFGFQYDLAMGDLSVKRRDNDYVYDLPFEKGKACKLFQGYNGKFSHRNENSLDFMMPEGSAVLAAREGTVVEVVQNNNQSCPSEECKKFNNYITILHDDGTFARYAHLQFNGAKVKQDDLVKKGQIIGLSGSTGWTTRPHLHFVCFSGAFGKPNTLVTRFRTDDGKKITLLQERVTYRKEY